MQPLTRRTMPDETYTYAELRRTMMTDLRNAHPEWDPQVFSAYEARIAAWFKRLERKQDTACV